MTLYTQVITVPPATRPRQAQSTLLEVQAAVVDHVSIAFEDGCFRTVGVRLLSRNRQFAPHDPPGGWLFGNNEKVEWREEHTLDGPPYLIDIQTHSMAADYPHEVEVRLEIVKVTMERALSDLTYTLNQVASGLQRKR